MIINKRKIVLVGTGMVGTSFAYAALNQNICDEFVLVDLNKKRAQGEAMDLNHGLAFSSSAMRIYQGDYDDCSDADIVVIAAGVNQQPGESRLSLLTRNAKVFKSIIDPVVASGFNGIFLVATNPVDIMTHIAYDLSGFDSKKVIGTGTTLDTARLRYLLGKYFKVDPRNMHAYVIGEHGDSEFVPWSQALLATKPVLDILEDNPSKYNFGDLDKISVQVRTAAEKIIEAKDSTYYGIGMALTRICRAILNNENSVLTISTKVDNHFGLDDVYLGAPCILNNTGVNRIVELKLTDEEHAKLRLSAEILKDTYKDLDCSNLE